MTKLSSSLPKEYEDDGLSSINRQLAEYPHETRMIVAMVDCKSVTKDMDSGFEIATARILQIEPFAGIEADQLREMLEAARERRTGMRPLPMEQVDRETGEINLLKNGSGVHFGKFGGK